MGNLIFLTRPTGPTRREAPLNSSAEILFFTGVRYHRMPETPVEPSAPKIPGRRRSEKAKKAAEARRIKRHA